MCISYREKKRKCSVKGLVSESTVSLKLANLKISSKEDVAALGLGTSAELISLRLVFFQYGMNGRLRTIGTRLDEG